MAAPCNYTRANMTRWILGPIVLLCACATAAPERPQSQSVAPAPPLSLEAQTIELERGSRPGPEHHRLAALCGEWNVTMVSVDERGRETEIARGVGQLESILDGRFVRWSATLGIAGAPRTTMGFLGFDLRSKTYELLMISNLATGMEVARGQGDPERGGLRFTLEQVDPASGASIRAISVLRIVSKDHFALDQIANDSVGQERVVQRHHYRRKLSPSESVPRT